MSEKTCDIHDVVKSASDLVAFGCSIGATQLYDSFMQIQFSSIVSSFANEIILAVDEGVISAQQGIQQIRDEYTELSSKALFYAQNGIGVLAGVMQIQAGASTIKNTRGINTPLGILYSAHGVNNIYEGSVNIYNGPNSPSVVGPVRKMYQNLAKDAQAGNISYYSVDLGLSAFGVFKPVRKVESLELFRRDPINYERAFRQMGRLTLAFEALVDAITIKSIGEETSSKKSNIETN